jgi:hypothetical protein
MALRGVLNWGVLNWDRRRFNLKSLGAFWYYAATDEPEKSSYPKSTIRRCGDSYQNGNYSLIRRKRRKPGPLENGASHQA